VRDQRPVRAGLCVRRFDAALRARRIEHRRRGLRRARRRRDVVALRVPRRGIERRRRATSAKATRSRLSAP
jgi:hypothetical protein